MASTKELLKEKINWRIVNLIRDKFTRYEDNNMSCELSINIAGFDAVIYNYSTRKIFEYGTENEWYSDDVKLKYLLINLNTVDKNTFHYSILIEQMCDEGEDDDECYDVTVENEMETKMIELKNNIVATGRLEYIGEINFGQLGFKEK